MADITEIREPNFSLDLLGEWMQTPSDEPGTSLFCQIEGPARLSVTLLGVRPVFALADPSRLLEDYMSHRSRFEMGRDPALGQSEPVVEQVADALEGSWSGADPIAGRLVRHRVLLAGSLLADFAFEAVGLDDAAFALQADASLASATASI